MTFILVAALTLLPSHPAALRPPALLATPPRRAAAPSMLDAGAAWSAYNAALVDPSTALLTKSVTAGGIIGAGDAAAQLVEGSKTGAAFDGARYLRWAIFGLVLQGPWTHAWYLTLDGLLPPTEDPFSLITLEKVGLDQFFQAPIFTMVILCFGTQVAAPRSRRLPPPKSHGRVAAPARRSRTSHSPRRAARADARCCCYPTAMARRACLACGRSSSSSTTCRTSSARCSSPTCTTAPPSASACGSSAAATTSSTWWARRGQESCLAPRM